MKMGGRGILSAIHPGLRSEAMALMVAWVGGCSCVRVKCACGSWEVFLYYVSENVG